MNRKKNWLARLTSAARWRLGAEEAEDVIADYREMIGDPPRPDEELVRELGKPKDAIRSLTTAKVYGAWLAVFIVMTVCILAPGISGCIIGAPLWIYLFDGFVDHPYGAYFAALGAVIALVWFRWQGRKEKELSKAVPVLLVVFLVCIGAVLLFCWGCARDFDMFCEMWGQTKVWFGPWAGSLTSASIYLSRIAMGDAAAVFAFIGVFAVVKARTGDRRWAAVYVLAVTAILVALLTLDWTGRMDLSDITVEECFRQMLLQCSAISAVGLVGAGVALC